MFSADRASPPARDTIRSTTSSEHGSAELVRAASHDDREILGRERLELVHLRAREQRGVDLVVRVLGRRADQRHEAFLHRRQQRVLLRLVEAVDLVEEEDRAVAGRAEPLARARQHLAHILDRRRNGGELLERGARRSRRRCARASSFPTRAGRRRSTSARGPRRSRAAAPSPRPARAAGPTNSSSVRGRRRRASGATSPARCDAASEKRSLMAQVCSARGRDQPARGGDRPPQPPDPGRHDEPAGQRDGGRRAPARLPRGERRRVRALRARARARESRRAHPRLGRRADAALSQPHGRRSGRRRANGRFLPSRARCATARSGVAARST